ncbi:MAG TPA: helix-turn-helix domain-containing protein [Firmicutes bacterium]|nr:helix-turn-helix domain-containing protein [Bacillota bacterium]
MEQLEALGKTLKEAREAQGLALEEVEAKTKIRKVHLKNIEAGRPLPYLNMAYFRLFVKTYAECLGLDSTKLLTEYLGHPTDEEPEPQTQATQTSERPRRAQRARANAVPKWVFGFIVLAIAAIAFLAIRLVSRPASTQLEPAPAKEAQQVDHDAPKEPAQPPEKPRAVLVENTAYNTVYELVGREAVISLEIVAGAPGDTECWISAVSDGKQVYQGLMKPGHALEVKAAKQAVIRSGKPWMCEITINGEKIGRMGGVGEPRNLTVRVKNN